MAQKQGVKSLKFLNRYREPLTVVDMSHSGVDEINQNLEIMNNDESNEFVDDESDKHGAYWPDLEEEPDGLLSDSDVVTRTQPKTLWRWGRWDCTLSRSPCIFGTLPLFLYFCRTRLWHFRVKIYDLVVGPLRWGRPLCSFVGYCDYSDPFLWTRVLHHHCSFLPYYIIDKIGTKNEKTHVRN